jgi:hypothetical protein
MTTSTRLDKARTKLTPKQIVLHMVREAHAAGSPMAYVKRTLREGAAGTICGRIERSMTGEVRGRKAGYTEETTQKLRDAQREGTFLFGLATQCWRAVMEAKEALDLRWMLWNLALLAQGSWEEWTKGTEFEDAESPMSLERVGMELRRVRDDVLALQGAIEIIEARYFGMPVLFPKDREWLDDLAAQAVEMLGAMDRGFRSKTIAEWAAILGDEASTRAIVSALIEPEGRDATKAAESKQVRAAAIKHARLWIRLIQAQIHNRMDEECAGTSTLVEAMEMLGEEARP